MQLLKLSETKADASEPLTLFGLIYGDPGTGKSSLAASAPSCLYADMENGTKFFGKRGLFQNLTVGQVRNWAEVRDVFAIAVKEKYQTVVFDPVGELLTALQDDIKATKPKMFNGDGQLTISGWGELKDRFRRFTKALRDAGINVILVGHVTEKAGEDGAIIRRPKLLGKIGEELVEHLDFVGYLESNATSRVLHLQGNPAKFYAKNRATHSTKVELGSLDDGFDLLSAALQ